MEVRLSALRTSRTLLPRNFIILMFLLLISVRGCVNTWQILCTPSPPSPGPVMKLAKSTCSLFFVCDSSKFLVSYLVLAIWRFVLLTCCCNLNGGNCTSTPQSGVLFIHVESAMSKRSGLYKQVLASVQQFSAWGNTVFKLISFCYDRYSFWAKVNIIFSRNFVPNVSCSDKQLLTSSLVTLKVHFIHPEEILLNAPINLQ
jgi:hypothetical protein